MDASHVRVTLGPFTFTEYWMFDTGARSAFWVRETSWEKRSANNATAPAMVITRSVVICVLGRYRVLDVVGDRGLEPLAFCV